MIYYISNTTRIPDTYDILTYHISNTNNHYPIYNIA